MSDELKKYLVTLESHDIHHRVVSVQAPDAPSAKELAEEGDYHMVVEDVYVTTRDLATLHVEEVEEAKE